MTRENHIEESLINKLSDLKYTYRADIRDKISLEKNFREKFEALNRVSLSEAEFARLRDEIVNPDVFSASKILREQQYFQREDGTPLHYTLVNIKDWCKNEFEVINQLRMNTDNSNHRYDVIILINGIPVVQIELKTLDITPRKAMQQIVDYKNDPGNGYTNSLLCFMQLFIVSNKTNTYYFANNRNQHFAFNADEQFLPVYQFADEKNKKITHLDDFSDKFLSKCILGEMISKYMVLVESEQKLLVMRPYQIYAVKAIVNCIEQNRGNGYIWHTTGSGKTLTSFKASTLLKDNRDVEKCLFVVDRKDLDRQTREEFNKFQEGSVEENTNTETLVRRLLSTDYSDKVIVTTIQKLGLALDGNFRKENGQTYKERLEPLKNKRIVFIFDECHRSQFGDNHKAIKEFFPNAQLFGFTGTPIFDDNAIYKKVDGEYASYKTTKDIFQKQLHAYTITNAIDDRNVLRFHIDYFKGQGNINPNPGEGIAQQAVAEAILEKHDSATHYKRFNAVLATASINNAIEYYNLFKALQKNKKAENPDYIPLNIACVFSPPTQALAKNSDQKNIADIRQLQEDLEQEKADNQVNPEEKKKVLTAIIADYNKQYGTNHTINEFDSYYQDIQQRVKDHKYSNADYPHHNKIDILIVVDMLLTGFDSKYLNTLYVDKNLKHHGLIQAFSRTNRVLNDTKPYGNILDFRSQQQQVDEAIMLFSGEDHEKSREIWLVDPAPIIIEKYQKAVEAMGIFMESHNLVREPQEVYNLRGDAARVNFVKTFKEVQRLRTQLDQYTDLNNEQKGLIEKILPEDTLRSYRSSYLETAKQLKEIQEKEGENASLGIQQLDFEFVLFASALIDYDYIMGLIADNTNPKSKKQKMSKEQLIKLLSSSSTLMDEKEDLTDYINQLDWDNGQDEKQLKQGYETFKTEKNEKELADIAQKHGLETTSLKTFTDNIISRMIFDGEKLTDLLEPLELSWKERRVKELALMEDLIPQLKKLAQGREISGLTAYE
ncbi:DEAD/DEAH box helicase [Elizabethkingia meningoseptica]|uniref:type I restriction endonuclease subunit R n=1 Tax=Elizabethkingia meningoseptica TaxID=238 RepID=UPI000332C803|nr:type I restriction endonuclease subunit R [Elizabethkingia meningoseptica]AQX06678.1 DEAD/DEAH box helicase [Elizabethkingia meningoseptica]AQX48726.1 DEAD/DEAH box helicase [Elizabethkingia meningoseptica]EOR28771.1 type I restriction-modification system restriction subunit [Elizabethkingia meningoseptica ATCC 13253 = NBRC 12535]KUY13812.1 DEAD/DEAH box helicase [Elizabethkingia meningoseptica]OPB76442.1 DEAD/DEAH box helicase [Elizabethkingia meningoseptica]